MAAHPRTPSPRPTAFLLPAADSISFLLPRIPPPPPSPPPPPPPSPSLDPIKGNDLVVTINFERTNLPSDPFNTVDWSAPEPDMSQMFRRTTGVTLPCSPALGGRCAGCTSHSKRKPCRSRTHLGRAQGV